MTGKTHLGKSKFGRLGICLQVGTPAQNQSQPHSVFYGAFAFFLSSRATLQPANRREFHHGRGRGFAMKGKRAFWLLGYWLVLTSAGQAAEKIKPDTEGMEFADLSEVRYEKLLEWQHPTYPADLKAAGVDGEYRVRYVVDENGGVTEIEGVAGDERFKDAALAAIARWKYLPRLVKGHAVPFARETIFTFDHRAKLSDPKQSGPPYAGEAPSTKPPEELSAPDPVYPEFLGKRHLFGEVELEMSIEKDGHVSGVNIHRATHPDFITAALAAVDQWKFRPAMRGRLPERGEKGAVLSFVVLDHENGHELRDDWLELNGIKLRMPGNPDPALYFIGVPTPLALVDPVYPYDLRQRGVTGTVRARFTIDKEGHVVDIDVLEASDPAFGDSLHAALATWQFKPLYHLDENVAADFEIKWGFVPADKDSPDGRLLMATEKPVGARQLDKIPGVLFIRQPIRPTDSQGNRETGETKVEVVIDHDGRVCLPRVISATTPELGWAAATAVSQWYFETPRRGGIAVDTKVVIPLSFEAE